MKKLSIEQERTTTLRNGISPQTANRSRAAIFATAGALGLLALARPAAAQEADAGASAPAETGPDAGAKRRVLTPGGAPETAAPASGEGAADAKASGEATTRISVPEIDVGVSAETDAPASGGQDKPKRALELDPSGAEGERPASTLTEFKAEFDRITRSQFGLAAPDFGKTLLRPLLPGEGAVITRDASEGLTSDVNNRGIAMGDVGVSVAAPFFTRYQPSTRATVLYGRGGFSAYALRAAGMGEYEGGSTQMAWPVESKGLFQGGEGSAYRGNVEFHALFLSMPSFADRDSKSDKATGWDVAVRFGAGHSSLNTKLPYNRAGSVHSISVSDGAWSFDIGAELAHPNYTGAPAAIRFEAIGVNAMLSGEVVDAYAAFSGNFSRYTRLLLVPRFQDIQGNMGPQGELKLEGLPVSWLTIGAGFIGGYTVQKTGGNTGLLAGYGEAVLGGAAHDLKRASGIIRVGYAAEVGGSEFTRIPATPYVWLGFRAPFGMAGNEVK